MRASVACALLLAPCCMRDAYDLARDLCMRCLHGGFCGAACCWFVVARAVRLPCKLACLVRKRLQAGCKRLQTHTAGGGSMQARSQAWPWRMIWRMRVPESLQPCGHAPRVMHPCPGCLAACLPPNQLCSHALAPRQPRPCDAWPGWQGRRWPFGRNPKLSALPERCSLLSFLHYIPGLRCYPIHFSAPRLALWQAASHDQK